ncbi:MAG TPA: C40 family peptidase [Steroidobacteraceae bacterium]|jgi:cell wall-associated NlpC family hydrolase
MRALLATAAALGLAACATPSQEISRPPAAQSFVESPAPRPPAPPDARILMVDAATAMLGQPYRFGGAAPGGFDCSGLAVYAAAGAGIRLPRTAAEQLEFGSKVSRGDLTAGDLIFMKIAGKELHVAIALDDHRFIHAPSSRGFVRIDSLTSPPYSAGFIAARRVIPAAANAVSFSAPN